MNPRRDAEPVSVKRPTEADNNGGRHYMLNVILAGSAAWRRKGAFCVDRTDEDPFFVAGSTWGEGLRRCVLLSQEQTRLTDKRRKPSRGKRYLSWTLYGKHDYMVSITEGSKRNLFGQNRRGAVLREGPHLE